MPKVLTLARAQSIPGWMTPAELAWLATTARTCRRIVEIGCYQGRSTRALADHCPGVVYAVDPWTGILTRPDGSTVDQSVWPAFEAHLEDHLAAGTVIPWAVRSATAWADLLARWGPRSIDLVFLDGDHTAAAIAADLAGAAPLVAPGGILAGHDYHNATWPDVTPAVDAVAAKTARRLRRVDGIWWWRCS